MCARAYIEKLDPLSQAILDYIEARRGYFERFRMIHAVGKKTGESHKNTFYFRRLAALAFEGRIEAVVNRPKGELVIRFRRFEDNGLEELPDIEEVEA